MYIHRAPPKQLGSWFTDIRDVVAAPFNAAVGITQAVFRGQSISAAAEEALLHPVGRITARIPIVAPIVGGVRQLAAKAGIGPGLPMPQPERAPNEITQAMVDAAQAEADRKAQAEYDAQWEKDNAAALAAIAAQQAPIAPQIMPPSAINQGTVALLPVAPTANSLVGAVSSARDPSQPLAMPVYSAISQPAGQPFDFTAPAPMGAPPSFDVPPVVEQAAKVDKKIPWGAITTAGVLALTFLKR